MSQTQTKPFICPSPFQGALAEARRAWLAFGIALKREPTADETRGIDAIVGYRSDWGAERIEALQQLHADLLRHAKQYGPVETFTYHDGSKLHIDEQSAARKEPNPIFRWAKVKTENEMTTVREQRANDVTRFSRPATA